jgi:arylsulfatase A-like enzyme
VKRLLLTLATILLTATTASRAEEHAAPSPDPGVVVNSASPTTSPTTAPATQPAFPRRVLIISVDGLRPDMMLRCRTPNMRELFENGTYSFWARTTPHAITLPSHVSMLTGVIPRKHEVEWNKDLPLSTPVYPKFPTLFAVAKHAGLTTAMAAGKMKFDTLACPGTIDWKWVPCTEKAEDPDVARQAAVILREHKPQVMFVHLPGVDNVGHKKGWGSKEQEKAVEQADRAVGLVLGAAYEAGTLDETAVILTADHGGAGLTHLPDDPRARHIPWIATGPGIRRGVDLTQYPTLIINTEDTFATACMLMGLPPARDIDGKPMLEILENRGELLNEVAGPGGEGAPTREAALR